MIQKSVRLFQSEKIHNFKIPMQIFRSQVSYIKVSCAESVCAARSGYIMCGFMAQLVEQRTGNAEVMGSNPVEALIFSGFFFPIS